MPVTIGGLSPGSLTVAEISVERDPTTGTDGLN